MGAQENNGWQWNFEWRRHLFDRELESAVCFLNDIATSCIQPQTKDRWIWKPEQSGQYSVKSAYDMLRRDDMEGVDVKVFQDLWKLRIPPKIAVFAWRLLKERLQTKANLRRRQLMINDTSCPFCGIYEENEAHLFFLCDKILPLWWESMSWVNIQGAFLQNPRQHFSQHVICLPNRIRDNRWQCWWLALTWAVWKQE